MANTPPRLPIQKRSDEELLEDLCRELRFVAVNESDLPNGDRVVGHVGEVCAVHAELVSRHIDIQTRVAQLSEQTRWEITITALRLPGLSAAVTLRSRV